MKPNVKRFLAGAVVVVLLWAVTAVTDGGDTSNASDTEIASEVVDEAVDRGVDEGVGGTVSVETPGEAVDTNAVDSNAADGRPEQSPEPSADSSSTRHSDLPTIAPGELPVEAIDTLDLIASGGPYPYSKDDSVFQNREGILPDEPRGHYREYTVDTPGESDRGARRIVAGSDGALYYTDDHYDSFREIVFGQ